MAKITTFLYCESTQPGPNGAVTLNGPMQIMTPKYIPSAFSFSIFIGIIDLDVTEPHNIQFIFRNKDNNYEVINTGKLNLQTPENGYKVLPKELRGIMANLDFRNAELKNEGEYITEVILDNNLIGEYPIYVRVVDNG
ncbi:MULTISPECIES: DUF6941 family protein [Clostridium]|uniref:DUF6941 family protein n=1 Tax=Clostridium TaxID=1485 RepID=UPI0024BD395E|nr:MULTISPECIES: hypothetical protein [Clostridium]EGT0681288.1 hypothetical protein [Clostridium perfringens]MDU2094907.1 hypothetical protein [Clostridium perfringens]MDU2227908.1 hypothetical protein [Clostridium perfringens]MDU4146097.1 hypothetical protein [Clostridium sp.]